MVHFRIDTSTKELLGDYSDPTIDEIHAGMAKPLNLEIAEIGVREYIGDYSAMN